MIRRLLLVSALAVASTFTIAGPVAAKSGAIIKTGDCTGSTNWKLKLSPEDGRIEVEFEVDQNRNNRLWTVKIAQDGKLAWSGSRYTRAPSGSFTARRVLRETAGSDRIAVRATNVRTGEVCRGVLTSNF
jgi:hypothetical protein